MKKNIKIKDIDPMIFSGPSDKNLNLLDEHFNSKIVLRGSNLYVEGKKEEVQNIEKVVHDIIYIINKKQNISESEINLLLSSSNNEFLSSSISEVDEKVILYTVPL